MAIEKRTNLKSLLHIAGLRFVLQLFAGIATLVLIAFAGAAIYIANAGGLKAAIEAELSVRDKGVITRIETAELSFFKEGAFAEIALSSVDITYGKHSLLLPQVKVDVRPEAWLSGQLWQIELSQLFLDLVQDEETLSIAGDLGNFASVFDGDSSNANAADKPLAPFVFLANRTLRLTDSRIRLRQAKTGDFVTFDNLFLTMIYDDATGLVTKGVGVLDGAQSALISFESLTNFTSGLSEVSVRAKSIPLSEFAPFLPPQMQPFSALGSLDAEMMLLFDGGALQTGSGRIDSVAGTLPNGAPLDALGTTFRYSQQDGYLGLSDTTLALPRGQTLALSADITGIGEAQLRFTGALTLNDIPIDDLLRDWPEAALPDVRSYMLASFSGGDFQQIALNFTGAYAPETSRLTLSELAFEGAVEDVRIETEVGHISQLVGTASGTLSLDVMAGGFLRNAKADLQIQDGYIMTERADDASPSLRFLDLSGQIFYQPGQLHLPNISLVLKEEGAITADVTLGFDDARTLSGAEMRIASQGISLAALRHLMPQDAVQSLASYVDDNLEGGWFSAIDMALAGTFSQSAFQPTEIRGTMAIRDSDLRYHASLDPLKQVSADLSFTDNGLDVTLAPHKQEGFSLVSANLSFAPLIIPQGEADRLKRRIEVTADASAQLESVVPLVERVSPQALTDLPVSLDNLNGEGRVRLSLSAVLQDDNRFALSLDRLDGVVTNTSATDFYKGQDLSQAELVFGYDGRQFDASGSASFDDITGTISLVHDGKSVTLNGQIPPQIALSQTLSDFVSQEVTGAIGGRFVVKTQDGGDTISALLSADLTGAAIHIPQMNWAKLQREDGRAVGTFIITDGVLQRIDDITIEAGGLRASGHVQMRQDGAVEAAYLQNVRWPGNDITDIRIEQRVDETGGRGWSVIAQGPVIDLRNLRGASDTPSEMDLSFDVTSERLMIDDDVALFGQMTGKLSREKDGQATLQGALLYKGEALLEEGTIEAVFGASGEYLSAVGLIGGAEARLEFSPDEDGGAVLIITTQNAGRVLSGLGVTDTVRSGRMVLVNHFTLGNFRDYDTTIKLEEFNVIEAPAAVRAFSVLGLAGLYSLVEGDGTRFTTGEAQIETVGATHKITSLSASGGAVGVSLVGEYNRDTREVDVSGNLVPVNQFSKIIGAVPLFGDLLAGIDNAGIFTTQFNVKGPIDDPETSINAASLVPGVLRDIFSPDWLGRERERLFGADNQTADN